MSHTRRFAPRGVLAALASLFLLGACASLGVRSGAAEAELATPTPTTLKAESYQKDPRGKYVLIDVEHNELRFMDGKQVLWSAPVGTGTGFRLADETHGEWEFSTPTGVHFVQYKELDPVWNLPDWFFIENKLKVPPANSPLRKRKGELGVAAVYLGHDLAIHGTDKPELLGQQVSHGCIRLSNADVQRLFHNVQVGTPVVIVGRAKVVHESADSSAKPVKKAVKKAPAPTNPLAKLSTAQLLARLDGQLKASDTTTAWTKTASELVERGIKNDALALRGILSRAGRAEGTARSREYATFLADAFTRGSLRAVVSLARIDEAARARAASAIVHATMDLYAGRLSQPGAPWPTRRVPQERLGPAGQAGWKALQEAEGVYRATAAMNRMLTETAAR